MSIRTIVVGVDGSENSARALSFVTGLAAQTGARVIAVHAFHPLDMLGKVEPPVDFAELAEQARRSMESEWCKPLADAGVEHECLLVEDKPVPALAGAARDHDADLVVVGARGLGPFRQMVLGSTSAKLPHETDRPVTIVP